MDKDKELLILDTALTSLLDNFQYDPEDYADLEITEEEIIKLLTGVSDERLRRFNAQQKREETHG
jgi:hypothetical protein